MKQTESTAFGMTDTVSGLRVALRTVFSLLWGRRLMPQTGWGVVPGVGDTDDMVDVSQNHLQQFVGDDGAGVGKAKERVVGEDSSDSQCPGMQDALMAEGTECLQEEPLLTIFGD